MNSEKRNQNFMEQKWTEKKEDGYRLIQNEDGPELGISEGSRVKILVVDGYAFKDLAGAGELLPYTYFWRRTKINPWLMRSVQKIWQSVWK